MASTGPLPQDQVRSHLTSLVDVLQYVHSFQIIHRDIKPANIVSQPGQLKQPPMLVDFGAAKQIHRNVPANTVIGSAGYAAPEQSMGQATFASDIYSLGLTCLHLLTGMHPFALYSAGEDRWVWPDYLAEPLDPRLAQVLTRMVARSLQQRYETMEQVALDLQFSQKLRLSVPQELPKQILSRAKASVPGLKGWLDTPKKAAQSSVLSKLWPNKAIAANPAIAPITETNTQTWQRLHRLAPGIGLTQQLAMNPDGEIFASGSADGAVSLWHWPTGQLLHTFARKKLIGNGHAAAVTALSFHPDGRALYSASADGTIKEWDSRERQLLNTLSTQGWTPTDLQVSSDGAQLVCANSDGQMVLWSIATLLPTAKLAQHQQSINAIALSQPSSQDWVAYHSADYCLIISASDDGTLKLWRQLNQDAAPQLAKTIRSEESSARMVGVALSHAVYSSHPSPAALIAATTERVNRYALDESLTVSEPTLLVQSPQKITAIALSTDGILAVGSEDRMLTLWDIATGECVAKLAHDWGVSAIAFAPNGQALITASEDEVISIWQRQDA